MAISLIDTERVIVVGAGHGIGLAAVQRLIVAAPKAQIHATYRRRELARDLLGLAANHPRLSLACLDPTLESQIAKWAAGLGEQPIDLMINCVGTLHDERGGPEKKLDDVNPSQLEHYFRVNTLPTVFLAKHLKKFFKNSKPAVFAALSAKVGSISDNHLGGWYGYRASKAALNMILQTVAREFARYHCHTSVLALHPGTTVTDLSKPFIARTKYQLHTPEETADNLLKLIEKTGSEDKARFLSWDGSEIPW